MNLEYIKAIIASVKNSKEIPAEEKEKAVSLLAEVARIIALY